MTTLSKVFSAGAAIAARASKHLEEMEQASLVSKETGNVDVTKVKKLIDGINVALESVRTAIDQLQQRVSNVESAIGRLDARLPVSPAPKPKTLNGGMPWPPSV